MDTNTLIELAAKAVEVIGMIEENREREREGCSRSYGEKAFREVAGDIRKMAMRTVTALPEESETQNLRDHIAVLIRERDDALARLGARLQPPVKIEEEDDICLTRAQYTKLMEESYQLGVLLAKVLADSNVRQEDVGAVAAVAYAEDIIDGLRWRVSTLQSKSEQAAKFLLDSGAAEI